MAKLFEEVLNGTVHSPSADILIHFCHGDNVSTGATPAPSASANASSPGGGGGACRRPASPRVTIQLPRSASSPTRCLPQGGSGEVPAHLVPASIRCHTLVLRTQPSLLELLLPGFTSRHHPSVGRHPVSHSNPEPLLREPEALLPPTVATAATPRARGLGADVLGKVPEPFEEHKPLLGEPPGEPPEKLPAGPSAPVPASVPATAPLVAAQLAATAPAAHDRPPDPDRPYEVSVDDEPEVFLEMIKFVYLNTCHIDHSNVKAMMHIADKYGIEDIVTHCLQWMQDHFTATLFYHFLTFRLSSQRFSQLLRQSLLLALRSRRHFSLVTEGTDGQWEQLQVSFVEALLQSDELPVVSEAEVLHLLARWAKGALARQERACIRAAPAQESSPMSTSEGQKNGSRARLRMPALRGTSSASEEELVVDSLQRAHSAGESSDLDGSCSGECGGGEGSARGCSNAGSGEGAAAGCNCASTSEGPDEQTEQTPRVTAVGEQTREERTATLLAHSGARAVLSDMLRLLRTFRKSDMAVKISDIEPILQILSLNSLFSTKPPRETAALDPGFMIYRGVAGVNVPATFGERLTQAGELNQVNVVPHAWRGGSVSLGSHDFLQQQDGFRPSSVPDGGYIVFPRLWVRITCSSWSHREKRTSKSTTGLSRHSISGPIGGEGSAWDTVPSGLLSAMPCVNESASSCPPEKAPATLKTMQSQDDWEIGRKLARPGSAVPNLSDNEKIDHKVVCAVISGHMRHGIRIGQHERSSIYAIEELYGQCEEVSVGGSPTEVEFELQLTVQAPSHCGICRCALAVLPSDGARGAPPDRPPEPLLEVSFDASAEEHLHFYISSTFFDSNSSYSIALNWVLRPGMELR